MTTTAPGIDPAAFTADWQRWRAEREEVVASPDGILPVVSIDYLIDRLVAIDRLPGRWSSTDEGVSVELGPGEALRDGAGTVTGRVVLARPAEGGSRRLPQDDRITVELVRGNGWDIVRVRDAESAAVRRYAGTPAYAPDPAWRVAGRWIPAAQTLRVRTVSDRVSRDAVSPGSVEFGLHGRVYRLVALPAHGLPGHVVLLFRDATSGVTTHAAQRELLVALPAAGDEVVVDFTRAYNKPCAYSDFALCPLPPAGNVIGIAVEAGERIPRRHEHGGSQE